MNKRMTLIAVVGAFLIGGGVSAAVATPTTVAGKPTPAVTVTVPGPVVTETVEVKVPGPATNNTPDVCVQALDYADDGFTLAGEGFEAAGDGFTAVTNLDTEALSDSVDRLTATNGEIADLGPKWKSARDACKAAN